MISVEMGNYKRQILIAAGIFFILPALVAGQNYTTLQKGLPILKHFSPDEYPGHAQNWAITQDSLGYIYFGNNSGLLIYNGSAWKDIHLPNHSLVRSLHTAHDGTVYIGGDGIFAFVDSDSLGNPYISSMQHHVDSVYHDFGQIFQIQELEGKVYFQSYEYIFVWDGQNISVVDSENDFSELRRVGDGLQVRIKGRGIYELTDGTLHLISGSEEFANDTMFLNTVFGGNQLLDFGSKGLYMFDGRNFSPFNSPLGSYLQTHNIYRGELLSESELALATLSGGVAVLIDQGRDYRMYTRDSGLPTNAIYELYLDRERNLWIVGDNGIVNMQINSPVSKLSDFNGLEGTVTALEDMENQLYAGTTSGLFRSKMGSGHQIAFEKLFSDHVSLIKKTNDTILVSTINGLFQVENGESRQINSQHFRTLTVGEKNISFIGSTETGFYELKKVEGDWDVSLLFESDRNPGKILVHEGFIWALADGVFKMDFQGNVHKTYRPATEDGYQYANVLDSQLFVGTNEGMFVYRSEQDQFELQDVFHDTELGHTQVKSFVQCDPNNVWIRSNRKIKRFQRDNQTDGWQLIEDQYNRIDEGQTADVLLCGAGNDMWFGGTPGIYHVSDPDWEYKSDFKTNITSLRLPEDSLVYGGFEAAGGRLTLPFSDNEFRFTYAAASYVAPEENMYRTRLRGYDDDWSNWSYETLKDYTFVPEGTYTFEVQGRNIYNKMGTVASFPIQILPPWYRTIWAYIGYILIVGGIVYSIHRIRINRIMKEQRIRNRIASDLHDEVSATLSSISYFAQAIRQTGNGQAPGRFVDLISESASDAKEKITDIIWSVDPENDSWVNLLSKCRRFASDLLESKGIAYDLEIATDIPRPLPLETRQHLWLIFKEMVTNAARHSGATEVRIRFGYENGSVKLVIQDNGSGWDTETEVKGNGIRNIRHRASLLDGRLDLESDGSVGTRWTMELEC